MEDKSKIPRALQEIISRNERNKGKNDQDKFGYKITKNSREEILLYKKNGNTLWDDAIAKEIRALEKLGAFQFYPPKTKFVTKDGCQYALMHMIFGVKQ